MRLFYFSAKCFLHFIVLSTVIGLSQLGCIQNANAVHVLGGNISINSLDSLKYEVVLTFYRDCKGVSLSGLNWGVKCVNSNATYTQPITKTSIEDVTQVCDTITPPCLPQNTLGSNYGIEKHILRDTLDFINDTALAAFKNCCKILIYSQECCRNGAINTGVSGNFYTEAYLDICKAPINSTPDLTSYPLMDICCNQPVYYNMGGLDADGDSVSYETSCPLGSNNNCLSYSSPYSKDQPLTTYFPPFLPPNRRKPNKRASPPWGFTMEERTGEIIFTPTQCNQVTVITIGIKEWRKDSNGKMNLIGESYRDLQVDVNNCVGNNAPKFTNDTDYVALCEGEEYCFNVRVEDKPAVISENPLVLKYDTVRLDWRTDIKEGLIFTRSADTARIEEVKVCWTPAHLDTISVFKSIVFTAKDNSCPKYALSSKSYRFIVYPKARAKHQLIRKGCNKYLYVSDISDSAFYGRPMRRYQILDTAGNLVADSVAYFYRNKKSQVTWGDNVLRHTDTLYAKVNQPLIVKSTIENNPFDCELVHFDTIYPGHTNQLETDELDSVYCIGSEVELKTQVTNSTQQFNYNWKIKGNWHLDSTQTILLTIEKDFDSVFVNVSDSLGCAIGDTLIVYGKPNPEVDLGLDQRICFEDSFKLEPVIDVPDWKDHRWDPPVNYTDQKVDDFQWKFNSVVVPAGSDSVWVSEPGDYSLTVIDSMGCVASDTFTLYRNDSFSIDLGPDQSICKGDQVVLKVNGIDSKINASYRWYKNGVYYGNQSSYNLALKDSTTWVVEVSVDQNSQVCTQWDTLFVAVKPLPVVAVQKSLDVCCDQPGIALDQYLPSNPYQIHWSASKAGLVINDTLFAANGCDPLQTQDYLIQVEFKDTATQCSAVDSVKVSIHPLPNVIPNPAFYSVDVCCDQPGIALDQYLPSNPFINSWSLSDTGLIVNDTFYATKGCDPLQTKVYNVKVQFTDTTTQCSATDSGVIRINPLPTVQIDRVYYTVSNDSIEDFEICTGKGDVQLEGDPTGGEWSVSPNKTGLLLDDVFQTQEADTGVLYTLVYAFEDTLGCRSTDTTFLKVACDSALSVWSPGQDPKNALKVYIPNAFTPNNTGPEANNTFTPQIHGATEYHIQIFNRMGVMVYEGETMEKGWNGTYKGKPAAAGVYAYQIAVKDVRGRDQVINGVVTVIR